ncbi:glycine oxidase ThiO [Staphylococcus muscae]|uniref:glycine oxidase n=1 Tax=Staphylococcus muscae TaxID=1294 RepID=A0A240CCB9_9STAP|nr:glycine oxidase ThiO [Staphylococcus muscae]AVQ33932.1 glycine oxidase ThiO [Staphylococcus muscae]PNZ05957.1 glycine oxidase ThiO [Staphylococcus muscae]GGA83142.1 glycine oxidase ThiO [Staphylococcus muscae]SNW04688.1 glycine oxidase [Staphylococcus muscae]
MLQTVIIGGGVMGLSIARQLNAQGRHIHIIDRSTPRMNASYAAGGMLGAQNEFFEDTPLYRLAMASRAMMPDIAQQLLMETDIDIELQTYGLIKVATTAQHVPAVKKQFEFLSQQDHKIYELSRHQLRARFPHCNIDDCAAFKIHDDGQINANLYTQALLQSVSNLLHIDLHIQTEVLQIMEHASHYRVTTSKGDVYADELIIAAGAWSGALLQQLGMNLPTQPVKGDVKLIESSYSQLKETIFNMNGCYIVPKKPNRFLIGATSELDNWSTQNKAENLQWLDAESQSMIPDLCEHRVIKTWTGIRPITPDGVPIMGALRDNLYISTGHYRNGILLSPIVGQLMAQLVDGRTSAAQQLKPFSPIK